MTKELDVEKLIEAVRARPPLWNKLHVGYRGLEHNNHLWKEIGEELGCNLTDSELKLKWHNLRDCFRREIRFEQAGKKKRQWIYYNQMLFLLTPHYIRKSKQKRKKCIKQKGKISIKQNETMSTKQNGRISTKEKEKTKDGEDEVVEVSIKAEIPEQTFELEFKNSDLNNPETAEACPEYVAESPQDDISEELSEPVPGELVIPDISEGGEPSGYCRSFQGADWTKYCPRGEHRHSRAIKDDDYHFAMSILPHMRQVPLHRKLKMRIRITEVIAEEYGYNEAPS